MSLVPWLRLIRLPNLPTAPGDALAGAAVLMAYNGGSTSRAFAAAGAALGFYLFGLVDNDLVGAADDAVHAPERPLPSGAISRPAAQTFRAVCLFAALLTGALANLPPAWWLAVALLTAAICLYNRFKGLWLMGACRALSLLAGGAAVLRPKLPLETTFADVPEFATGLAVLGGVAVGWCLYIVAVTKLSEGEEQASEGLGAQRFVWGLAALVPLLAFIAIPYLMPAHLRESINLRYAILPAFGTLWTLCIWVASVWPLGEPHDSDTRRTAVGATISALLYLQLGFAVVIREFLIVMAVCWLVSRLIRRCLPLIRGS